MSKPGRNEPCYCGSGKKYKQCHMQADLAAEREQRSRLDAARDLWPQVLGFGEDERFDEARSAAVAAFWNDLYTAEDMHLMSPSEEERFLDWFVYDHVLPDGRRPVEVFASEQGDDLPAAQQALLEQWVAADAMAGYTLADYDQHVLQLAEFLSGAKVDVHEPSGHGEAPTGSVLIGRLLPVADHLEFSVLPAYIPPGEIADLPEKLEAAREAYAKEHPKATGAGFWRQSNLLLIHHALEQAQKAGRPPVARLDPNREQQRINQRSQHERVRITGPGQIGETTPHMAQTRRKAI